MSSDGKKITGVKALNINEESAEAIEKMEIGRAHV